MRYIRRIRFSLVRVALDQVSVGLCRQHRMCEGEIGVVRPRSVEFLPEVRDMPPSNTQQPAASQVVTKSAANAGDTHAVAFPQRTASGESQPQTAPPPEVGTVVGTFVLDEKLGEG